MSNKNPRSAAYQVIFHEVACSNEQMEAFQNDDSIYERLTGGFAYNEEVLDLEDQLRKRFWELVDSSLTKRQGEILHLCAEGLTQMEVAKRLGCNQSSIAKSRAGNTQYLPNNKVKTYGGSHKRLQKLIEEDPIINDILSQINEKRNKKW